MRKTRHIKEYNKYNNKSILIEGDYLNEEKNWIRKKYNRFNSNIFVEEEYLKFLIVKKMDL